MTGNRMIVTGSGFMLLPLLLVLPLIALHPIAGPAPAGLILDRAMVLDGAIWQILSGHIVHTDWMHMAVNGGALVLIAGLYGLRTLADVKDFTTDFLSGSLFISAGLLLFMPGLVLYCGLSGLLNYLLLHALCRCWQRQPSIIYPLVAAGALAKAIWETTADSLLATSSWQALPEAHLLGLAAASIVLACRRLWKRQYVTR